MFMFALGPQGFSDTNMLVFAMPTGRIGGLNQPEGPKQMGLHSGGI